MLSHEHGLHAADTMALVAERFRRGAWACVVTRTSPLAATTVVAAGQGEPSWLNKFRGHPPALLHNTSAVAVAGFNTLGTALVRLGDAYQYMTGDDAACLGGCDDGFATHVEATVFADVVDGRAAAAMTASPGNVVDREWHRWMHGRGPTQGADGSMTDSMPLNVVLTAPIIEVITERDVPRHLLQTRRMRR